MEENRQDIIRELSARTGLSEATLESLWPCMEELIEEIAAYVADLMNAVTEVWQKISDLITDNVGPLIEELREILDNYTIDAGPPRAIRKKNNRARARLIEQRYRAEIRRCEQQRFCRRIYKPPSRLLKAIERRV